MAVNEAPYLTTRVVALLMLLLFLFCIAADQFQCSKNGRQHLCSGPEPYYCASEYCRERVDTWSHFSYSERCHYEGTSEVVLAFVEVGPSFVSDRGSRISAYMVEKLNTRIQDNDFPRARTATNSDGAENWFRDYPYFLVDEYYKLSYHMRQMREYPRNETRYNVTSDAIDIPLHAQSAAFAYRTWTEAVEAVLPTTPLNDATQLATYFPNLYNALHAAVARHKKGSTTPKCDALHLVVYILVSPLASVRMMWDDPARSSNSLSTGYSMITGAVTRYLSTNKRISKYLDGVEYAFLYLPPPARQFKLRYSRWRNQSDSPPISPVEVVTKAVTDTSAALAFCNATNDEERAARCSLGCQGYERLNSIVAAMDSSTASGRETPIQSSPYPSYSDYWNCYFDVLQSASATKDNLTFDSEIEARFFDDCFHLSPEGGKAVASCALRLKSRSRRHYRYR